MFSSLSLRELALIFAAAALVLGGSACSLREQAPSSQLALKDSQGCLDTAGEKLDRYFDGLTTDAEVGSFWDCVDQCLQTFSERTRGKQSAEYSVEELQRFFQSYFVKDFKLTGDLMTALMELKQFLTGGAIGSVSRGELGRLRELVSVMREEAIRLRPHMPLLPSRIGREPMKDVTVERLELALTTLKSSAGRMGAELSSAGRGYRFSQLKRLLESVQAAPSLTDQPRPPSITLTKLIARLEFAKLAHYRLFVDEKGQAGQGDPDWITKGGEGSQFLTQVTDWFGALIRSSHLFFVHDDIHYGAGKERLKHVAHDWLSRLEAATNGHPGKLITFAQLEELLDALPQEDLPLQRETIRSLIKPVIQRYLGGLDFTENGRLAKGLHPAALTRVQTAFGDWYAGQTFAEALYRSLGADPTVVTHPGFEPEPLLAKKLEELFPKPQAAALAPSAKRLQGVIQGSRPLFSAGSSRIRLAAKVYDEIWRSGVEDRKHSFDGLSRMNWIQVIVRLLERGYVSSAAQLPPGEFGAYGGGVTKAELDVFFEHIKPVLDEFKLYDKNDPNTVKKRFNEGNYFMFSGDGDDRFGEREARELLAFILSGRGLCLEVHERIVNACQLESPSHVGPADDFNFTLVDARCHRRRFWQDVRPPGTFQQLPAFEKYLASLSGDEARRVQTAYEFAARKAGVADDKRVGGNDADGYSALAQYVEAAFLTFDRNLDGFIEPAEVIPEKYLKASELEGAPASRKLGIFHRFKRIVGEVAGTDNEFYQEAILHFMLERGRAPKKPDENPADMLYALGYTKAKLWKYRADRGRIIMLFAVMGAGDRPLPSDMLE